MLTHKLRYQNTINDLLYSPWYLLILSAITVFGWAFEQSALSMCATLSIGAFALIINRDALPAVPCLALPIFATSNQDFLTHPQNIYIVAVGGVLLGIAFVAHFFLFKPKFKLFKLTVPLALVSVALFLGGIGYIEAEAYLKSMTFIITLGPLMLCLYYFLMIYTCPNDKVDSRRYMCYILISIIIVLVSESLIYIIRFDQPLEDLVRITMDLGWGNRNTVGLVLTIILPALFYIAYDSKFYIAVPCYVLSAIALFIMILTFSRGGIVGCVMSMIVPTIYTLAKSKTRYNLIYTIAGMVLALSIFMLFNSTAFAAVLDKLFENINLDSTGRFELFAEAYNLFLNNSIFGVGIGYMGNNLYVPEFGMYWFHSTILQVIASTGMIGFIAYGIYYVLRAKSIFHNPSIFNVFVGSGVIAFELLCLIENGTFLPFPTMFIVIFITAFLEYSNDKFYPTPKRNFRISEKL